MKISISPNGNATAIYSPESAKLLQALGDISLQRASHVEPRSGLSPEAKSVLKYQGRYDSSSDTQWFADLSPTTPNLILGPFETNAAAIAAEVAYLNNNLSKVKHDSKN